MPIGAPAWPDCAFCTASMASVRMVLTHTRSMSACESAAERVRGWVDAVGMIERSPAKGFKYRPGRERLRPKAVPCDRGPKPKRRCGLLRFGLLNRRPNRIGRRRHRYVADTELAQGIEDGADHDGGRRRGAAFAAGLDTERVGRRQHLGDFGLEGRQGVGG